MVSDFGIGFDEKEQWCMFFPFSGFQILFSYTDSKELKCDEDIKATIYALGGPLPSELESFKIEFGGTEVKIILNSKSKCIRSR